MHLRLGRKNEWSFEGDVGDFWSLMNSSDILLEGLGGSVS